MNSNLEKSCWFVLFLSVMHRFSRLTDFFEKYLHCTNLYLPHKWLSEIYLQKYKWKIRHFNSTTNFKVFYFSICVFSAVFAIKMQQSIFACNQGSEFKLPDKVINFNIYQLYKHSLLIGFFSANTFSILVRTTADMREKVLIYIRIEAIKVSRLLDNRHTRKKLGEFSRKMHSFFWGEKFRYVMVDFMATGY